MTPKALPRCDGICDHQTPGLHEAKGEFEFELFFYGGGGEWGRRYAGSGTIMITFTGERRREETLRGSGPTTGTFGFTLVVRRLFVFHGVA